MTVALRQFANLGLHRSSTPQIAVDRVLRLQVVHAAQHVRNGIDLGRDLDALLQLAIAHREERIERCLSLLFPLFEAIPAISACRSNKPGLSGSFSRVSASASAKYLSACARAVRLAALRPASRNEASARRDNSS